MKRWFGGSTPATIVGTVAMVVGLILVGIAGTISRFIDDSSGSAGIAVQTSTRWDHWDTVIGVLGVTLMVLGGVITYIGRRPGDD